MIYFTSDSHLGHGNIIKYCNRPFTSLIEMDETIIRNCNDRVGEDDTLFFLGDFCMSKSTEASDAPRKAFDYYRSQIHCKNIIFVKGNHDANNTNKTPIESLVIFHGGFRIFLTHNPKYAREDFRWNFCGHTHGNNGIFNKLGNKSIIVDMSVDCWNFRPVNINEIIQQYSEWYRGKKNE